jgi:hypothetical protein
MSLDVYLYDNCCEKCGRRDLVFQWSITHNLDKMADEAGIYMHLWRPDEIEVSKAKQLIGPLEFGLGLLRSDPERFKKFEPLNGWGSRKGLCLFAERYLAACKKYPEATIEVSR